jgi:hypothetical protein
MYFIWKFIIEMHRIWICHSYACLHLASYRDVIVCISPNKWHMENMGNVYNVFPTSFNFV